MFAGLQPQLVADGRQTVHVVIGRGAQVVAALDVDDGARRAAGGQLLHAAGSEARQVGDTLGHHVLPLADRAPRADDSRHGAASGGTSPGCRATAG